MTDREINRVLRGKYPSSEPRRVRAYKLKMRYGKSPDRLLLALRRTREKLDILLELKRDQEQRFIAGWKI